MYIYIKGVTVRFGFDVLELRKFKLLVKNKATGTPYGVYYIQPSLASDVSFVGREGKLYLHLRGAFYVARFGR